MTRTRNIVGGVVAVAFGLLGMYCSFRAFQIHRELSGRPDIDDKVRDWSTGATACIVAAGVAVTLSRKKTGEDSVSGGAATSVWKSPVVVTLLLAVAVVIGVAVFIVLRRSERAAPTLAQPQAPTVPLRAPSP